MRPAFSLVFLFLFSSALMAQDVLDIAMYNQQLSFIDRGWDLIHKKEYHEASQVFEQAIEINDGNADAFVGAATAYMHLENYDRATERVDVALGMTNNQSDIYLLAGNIAFNSGNYEKALVAYTVAINNSETSEVKIDLAKCHFNRGNAYLALKKYKNAIADYHVTIKSSPSFAEAYHNRAVAKKNLDNVSDSCSDFHAAKYFGSKMSDKYLEDCEGTSFETINYSELSIPTQSTYDIDYSDTTLVDTLYYGQDWKLTNRDLASYYRVGSIKTRQMIFTGPFTDYYKNGQVMMKGRYDQNGKKSGVFEHFYVSGSHYSKGTYKENEIMGLWEFYNQNGELSEVIQFEDDDYYVVSSWDENGKAGVVDGSGKWKKVLSIQNGVKNYLIAHFKDRKKVKKWMIRTETGYVSHSETYKDGEFIKAEQATGFMGMTVPSGSIFTKKSFYSEALPIQEKFETTFEVTKNDYPYIKGSPEHNFSSPYEKPKAEISKSEPTYTGGIEMFYMFVSRNLEYPRKARTKKTSGKVIIKFTVEKDGSVSNIHCLSNLGNGLEEEAIRIISMTNQWNPAIVDGVPVVKSLTLPIHFKAN